MQNISYGKRNLNKIILPIPGSYLNIYILCTLFSLTCFLMVFLQWIYCAMCGNDVCIQEKSAIWYRSLDYNKLHKLLSRVWVKFCWQPRIGTIKAVTAYLAGLCKKHWKIPSLGIPSNSIHRLIYRICLVKVYWFLNRRKILADVITIDFPQ